VAIGVLPVGVAVAMGASSSCYVHHETTCDQESAPLVPLRGTIFAEKLCEDDAGVVRLALVPVRGSPCDGDGAAPAPAPTPVDCTAIIGTTVVVKDAQGGDQPMCVVKDIAGDAGGDVVRFDDQGRPFYPWEKRDSGPPPRVPQAGATVLVELCSLYSFNPDPSKAHPNYRNATITRSDGTFELMVPQGTVGIHTFKESWLYGRTEVEDGHWRAPENETFFAAVQVSGFMLKRPVLKDLEIGGAAPDSVPTVLPGETLSFSVTATSAAPDPMSEEVIVFEPTTGIARAFAPPSRGRNDSFKKGYPDGTWTASIPAPPSPGRYTFYADSTSEGCVNSNRVSRDVIVR
jgi:hypothetical protein